MHATNPTTLSKSQRLQERKKIFSEAFALEKAGDYAGAIKENRKALEFCSKPSESKHVLYLIEKLSVHASEEQVRSFRRLKALKFKQVLRGMGKFWEVRSVGDAVEWMESHGAPDEAKLFLEASMHASVHDKPIEGYKPIDAKREAASRLTVTRVLHWLKLDPPDMGPLFF